MSLLTELKSHKLFRPSMMQHPIWMLKHILTVHVTPPLGGHVTLEADEGGEWSGSWHASSNFGMGDLPGSFPVSMRVRTKHVEKTRVGLWDQVHVIRFIINTK
ncbi:hypothetical protein MTR_2g064750 [Medicago truncatula]|uniref:Uncharacterized protein n=1 Tax=Medicago truncatula TaxID=3880 RepID=G7IJ56_MEDTR|nr:hypothetical protein MTR_2g064750 [Medicago truncatula]